MNSYLRNFEFPLNHNLILNLNPLVGGIKITIKSKIKQSAREGGRL